MTLSDWTVQNERRGIPDFFGTSQRDGPFRSPMLLLCNGEKIPSNNSFIIEALFTALERMGLNEYYPAADYGRERVQGRWWNWDVVF